MENKREAQLAMARVKLGQGWRPEAPLTSPDEWIVAKVCSEYLQYCERGVAGSTLSKTHRDNSSLFLNDLCKFCGALPVTELKKGHINTWLGSHPGWKSPATHRHVIAIVLAAFNYAEENHEISNPVKGLKKPPSRPRLQSFSSGDEQTLYAAVDDRSRANEPDNECSASRRGVLKLPDARCRKQRPKVQAVDVIVAAGCSGLYDREDGWMAGE